MLHVRLVLLVASRSISHAAGRVPGLNQTMTRDSPAVAAQYRRDYRRRGKAAAAAMMIDEENK